MSIYDQVCLGIDIVRWSLFSLLALLIWRFLFKPLWHKLRDTIDYYTGL